MPDSARAFSPAAALERSQHCYRLDFDLCSVLYKGGDLDQRHRRKVFTHKLLIGCPDVPAARHILLLVGNKDQQSGYVRCLAARRGNNGDDVFKSLSELLGKVIADHSLLSVPPDLTGHE